MTYLTRYRPLGSVMTLPRDLDRWFENALGGFDWRTSEHEWFPAADVSETPEDLTIRVEVPGLTHDNIKISVENDIVTIRGEKSHQERREDETFYRNERSYGAFQRSFSLPNYVNADDVHASLDNGVLSIRFSRREETKAREIAIQGNVDSKKIQA